MQQVSCIKKVKRDSVSLYDLPKIKFSVSWLSLAVSVAQYPPDINYVTFPQSFDVVLTESLQ